MAKTKTTDADNIKEAERDLAKKRRELDKAVEYDVQRQNSSVKYPGPTMDPRGPTRPVSPRDKMLLAEEDGTMDPVAAAADTDINDDGVDEVKEEHLKQKG